MIVSYFVRIQFENKGDEIRFPLDLNKEIERFASRGVDIWYSKIIGPDIIIQDSLAKWIPSRKGWRAAYSTYTCNAKDGECIEWSLRLKSNVQRKLYISLIKDDEGMLEEKRTLQVWARKDNDKFIYRASSGGSRLASNETVEFPGEKFAKEGDTLMITVDEYRRVSMKVNNKDYGYAPNFALKPEKYRLGVNLCGHCCEIEFY